MIRAFGDRVIARLVELPKKKGLLIYPDEKKDFQVAQVVSIPWELDDVMEVFEGEYIYTRKYGGIPLEFDHKEYVSFDLKEILGVAPSLSDAQTIEEDFAE